MSPLKVFKSTCSHPAHLFNTSLRQFFPRNNGAPAPQCALRLAEEHRNRKRRGGETQAHNIELRRRWQLAAGTRHTAVLVQRYCLILHKPSNDVKGKLWLSLIDFLLADWNKLEVVWERRWWKGSYCEKCIIEMCSNLWLNSAEVNFFFFT